jgi:dimethylaniline monooxygenase (N-oxide forming)
MLKQLRDDGFAVTGFERRDRVGGLWAYSDNSSYTTALPRTIANISKFTCGFSDFPMPDRYPIYMKTEHFQDFMESYARHFDTLRYWNLNTTVLRASRNADDTRWALEVEHTAGDTTTTRTLEFDKVVFCHGYQTKAIVPTFEGQEKFEGIIMHSQQYRSPEPFKGKRVLVLGLSSTTGDIAPDLMAHAAHPVYLSHRRGALPFRRFRKGVPNDMQVTWRRRQMSHFTQRYFPGLAKLLADSFLNWFAKVVYPDLRPEWRLLPIPSVLLRLPGSFENVIPFLADGSMQSVHGLRRFLGPKTVELLDGTVLEDVDAVLLCTGYRADWTVAESFMERSTPGSHGYKGEPIYRMWMNLFPPRYADSCAFLCYSAYGKSNGFSFADVTSMAVSNVFRGVEPLPSQAEMNAWIDRHHDWVASRWALDHSASASMVKQWEFQGWLHRAAGTGMEALSPLSWKGWKFWWGDRELYKLMNDGVETAHAYRFFETGKRKTWDGAREAIVHANEVVKQVLPITEEQEKEILAGNPGMGVGK